MIFGEGLASVKQLLYEGNLINLYILQVKIQSFLHRKHYLVIKKSILNQQSGRGHYGKYIKTNVYVE